ncbi:MAG: TIGR00268 family protein, partial [Clostridiales Family XIII bacterium]|nr:TIGR00268 family protein [Clostridiales Family XIII bacterium]
SNISDDDDYRPGQKAIKELGIKSPLKESFFTKNEIRTRSKILNLPTFDKPAFACLSSRFSFGEEITREKLSMIDKAEDYLLKLGFKNIRVRIHGDMARIEVLKNDFPLAFEKSDEISKNLKTLGFKFVSLDLSGYKMGNMNFTV